MSKTENMWFWQDYWDQGQMACCLSDDLRKGYDGSLAAVWRDFFVSLDDGARILDLCTGNGGVFLLALEAAGEANREFDLTGVDKASIDPSRHAATHSDALSQVAFVGNTDIAALPFEDTGFDAVISQFGIEYAGLDTAAAEAVRVLSPGGSLMFVVHATDGVAEQAAREELKLVPELGSEDLHDSLRRALLAVDSLTRGHGTRPQADAAVESFIKRLEALDALLVQYPNQATILTLGRKLLKLFEAMERMPVEQILGYVEASERAVQAHLLRLEALSRAACDHKKIDSLCRRLDETGIDAEVAPILDGEGGKLAWCIRGQKA